MHALFLGEREKHEGKKKNNHQQKTINQPSSCIAP
jgi:hypothetical protein